MHSKCFTSEEKEKSRPTPGTASPPPKMRSHKLRAKGHCPAKTRFQSCLTAAAPASTISLRRGIPAPGSCRSLVETPKPPRAEWEGRCPASTSHPCHARGDCPHHLVTWPEHRLPAQRERAWSLGKKKARKPQRSWVEAHLLQQPPPSCIRLLLKAEINSAPHAHPYFSFHLALCTCAKAIK